MYTHDIDYVIRTLGVGATYRGYREFFDILVAYLSRSKPVLQAV